MGDASRELADGLEFLRLNQLFFELQPFGNIFRNHFDAWIAVAWILYLAPVQANRNRLCVLAPPFHDCVDATLAGVLGVHVVTDDRVHVKHVRILDGQEVLLGVIAEHVDQGWIHKEQVAFAGDPIHPIGRVRNQAAVARLAFAQRHNCLSFGDAERSFLVGADDGRRQTGEIVFENVVGHAQLEAFHGQFVTQSAAQQDYGDVRRGFANGGQRVHSRPALHAVIGNHNVEPRLSQLPRELLAGERRLRIHADAGFF